MDYKKDVNANDDDPFILLFKIFKYAMLAIPCMIAGGLLTFMFEHILRSPSGISKIAGAILAYALFYRFVLKRNVATQSVPSGHSNKKIETTNKQDKTAKLDLDYKIGLVFSYISLIRLFLGGFYLYFKNDRVDLLIISSMLALITALLIFGIHKKKILCGVILLIFFCLETIMSLLQGINFGVVLAIVTIYYLFKMIVSMKKSINVGSDSPLLPTSPLLSSSVQLPMEVTVGAKVAPLSQHYLNYRAGIVRIIASFSFLYLVGMVAYGIAILEITFPVKNNADVISEFKLKHPEYKEIDNSYFEAQMKNEKIEFTWQNLKSPISMVFTLIILVPIAFLWSIYFLSFWILAGFKKSP